GRRHHPGGGDAHLRVAGGQRRGGHLRVRRQAVDLGLVQQQEHRTGPSHAVLRVRTVQAGLGHPALVEVRDAPTRLGREVLVLAEADRLGGAGRGAGGLLALDQAIVAQSALAGGAHPIDLLVTIRVRRDGAVVAPLDHSEGAGAHTGAAAVADVLLHHHRAVLRPEDRPRGAHVQAAGVRAVLAHVRGHQPAELGRVRGCAIGAREVARRGRPAGAGGSRTGAVHAEADQLPAALPSTLDLLLDLFADGYVPPGVVAWRARCVGARAEDLQVAVDRVAVPLLARHLAGLAADADRGVGEEALARMGAVPAGIGRGTGRS